MLEFCSRFLLNNVYKRMFGIFLILFRSWVINKNLKNECVEPGLFLFLQITQDLSKIKKIPKHPFVDFFFTKQKKWFFLRSCWIRRSLFEITWCNHIKKSVRWWQVHIWLLTFESYKGYRECHWNIVFTISCSMKKNNWQCEKCSFDNQGCGIFT